MAVAGADVAGAVVAGADVGGSLEVTVVEGALVVGAVVCIGSTEVVGDEEGVFAVVVVVVVGLGAGSWVVSVTSTAANSVGGGSSMLMAPTVAVAEMLQRTGLSLQDFDFYEIHEAFAAQVMCTLAAWESESYCKGRLGLESALGSIDHARLNVKGSSLAVGHPFAATGARIVGTLGQILQEAGSGRGLISICTAGGMGVAAILERE